MAEIKLQKRVVYAGDVHIALLKAGWGIKEAVDFVKSLPEADVAPVRCKDCAHFDGRLCSFHSVWPDQYSSGHDAYMEPNDFCSYGERKSGTQPQREVSE